MANKDAAFGLRPARMMGGGAYTGGQSRYRIANNQSGAIFQGDLVKQLTGGTVSRAAASSTVPVVGVFNGCQFTDPTSKEVTFSNHYPGSVAAADIIAFIIDDPNVVFEVQADDTFPIADLFGNFDLVDHNRGHKLWQKQHGTRRNNRCNHHNVTVESHRHQPGSR